MYYNKSDKKSVGGAEIELAPKIIQQTNPRFNGSFFTTDATETRVALFDHYTIAYSVFSNRGERVETCNITYSRR